MSISTSHSQTFHEGPFLLTGVTGFLGSEVFCRLARSAGFERVCCLVRQVPKPGSIFFKRLQEHGLEGDFAKIRFIETDFSTPQGFSLALSVAGRQLQNGETYAIVHMAAIIHAKGAREKAEQRRLNVDVTDELLDWAALSGSHFVYMSSVVSFGAEACAGHLRTEDDFAKFPWISKKFTYYTSKRESHLRVIRRAKIPATLLCPGIIHGALEMEKSSRKHLRYLREGKLKFAPSGSGNFVGLDRVAQAVVQSATLRPQEKITTKLLVDENRRFVDYFNLYVRLARGPRAQVVRQIPALLGYLAVGIYILFSMMGVSVSFLESLAQGSLHLNFKSVHTPPPTEGLEANLKKSFQ